MNDVVSLWPSDLDEALADRRDSKTILAEQAALLALVSAGDITAEVVQSEAEDSPCGSVSRKFQLNLLSRDGYTHELLSVFVDCDLPYPCDLVFENEVHLCATPSGLVSALGKVLTGDSTKSLLLALAVRSNTVTAN